MQASEKKAKKLPRRHCAGCGEEKNKLELLRIVRTPEGEILLDDTGKKAGRGAYLCRDVACLRKAQKAKRVEHALKCRIPDEIYEALALELQNHGKE